MTQRADATYYKGTPTEMIVVSGKTEAGRYIEMCILPQMAIEIISSAKYYKVCQHVGHALWHAKNPEAEFPCEACKAK